MGISAAPLPFDEAEVDEVALFRLIFAYLSTNWNLRKNNGKLG